MQIYLPEIDDDFDHFDPQAFVSEQSLPSLPMSCSLWSISRQQQLLPQLYLAVHIVQSYTQAACLPARVSKAFFWQWVFEKIQVFSLPPDFQVILSILNSRFLAYETRLVYTLCHTHTTEIIKFTEWFSVSLNKNLKKRVAF